LLVKVPSRPPKEATRKFTVTKLGDSPVKLLDDLTITYTLYLQTTLGHTIKKAVDRRVHRLRYTMNLARPRLRFL